MPKTKGRGQRARKLVATARILAYPVDEAALPPEIQAVKYRDPGSLTVEFKRSAPRALILAAIANEFAQLEHSRRARC